MWWWSEENKIHHGTCMRNLASSHYYTIHAKHNLTKLINQLIDKIGNFCNDTIQVKSTEVALQWLEYSSNDMSCKFYKLHELALFLHWQFSSYIELYILMHDTRSLPSICACILHITIYYYNISLFGWLMEYIYLWSISQCYSPWKPCSV